MPMIEAMMKEPQKIIALLYCQPGVGKSTTLGVIAEQSVGKTLILDVDRTVVPTLSKREVVKDLSKIEVWQIDNISTWSDWSAKLMQLDAMFKEKGSLPWENICVDNISELERCILSDLGSQGKNKGVPAQADYQYMQFKLVNSLRLMKSLGVNVFWTAWETTELFQNADGSSYSRQYPKISAKIVDNICGLCDVVGKILVNREGERGILLDATQSSYAKNQRDTRKVCKVAEFLGNKKEA